MSNEVKPLYNNKHLWQNTRASDTLKKHHLIKIILFLLSPKTRFV